MSKPYYYGQVVGNYSTVTLEYDGVWTISIGCSIQDEPIIALTDKEMEDLLSLARKIKKQKKKDEAK